MFLNREKGPEKRRISFPRILYSRDGGKQQRHEWLHVNPKMHRAGHAVHQIPANPVQNLQHVSGFRLRALERSSLRDVMTNP